MPLRPFAPVAVLLLLAAGGCADQAAGGGGARERIRVVGSSTVFPFTSLVAERYVADHPDAPAPVIESTGTGAGMKLFCAGIGAAHPDIADASRRMRRSEYAACERHGVGPVVEVPIGIDGVAVAGALRGPLKSLTAVQLFRALAAAPDGVSNRSRRWSDVDPALPATPILVYGPPATSGTRDALAALILARGCEALHPPVAALRGADEAAYAARCHRIREDGLYVDAGESDNLIVQKLKSDPDALGILGYAYLAQNAQAVRGIAIDGIAPQDAAIADGRYPGARLLYLYVKRAHLAAVPGLAAFVAEYADAWGPGGPLVRHGLIAAPAATRTRAAAIVRDAAALDPASLH